MDVVVLGGTRFIGRAIADELLGCGHHVTVVHRGHHEPDDLVDVAHVHVDRADIGTQRDVLRGLRASAVVDVSARNGQEATAALEAIAPSGALLVALSSCDVYRAFGALHAGLRTDAVPLDESAPVRTERFALNPEAENLEVEEAYLRRGGTVLRLGAVYGERDYQRRLEFMLRRVRAGRSRIPIGAGTMLFSHVYVRDVAAAVRLVLEQGVQGEVFNVSEAATWSFGLFAQRILEAADHEAELVRVRDRDLPPDLALSGSFSQHLLFDAAKAREVLDWTETPKMEALARTVSWDLANPPDEAERRALPGGAGDGADPDRFDEDDAALAQAID